MLNDTTASYKTYNPVYSNNKMQGSPGVGWGGGRAKTTHASYLDPDSQTTETNF